MSQIKVSDVKRGRGSWAAVGFILIVAIGVIVWVVTPDLTTFIDERFLRNYRIPRSQMPTIQIGIGLILFFLLSTIAALIVSALAPKKPINVKEEDLIKEREAMQRARKAERVRQRAINREFREYQQAKQAEQTGQAPPRRKGSSRRRR